MQDFVPLTKEAAPAANLHKSRRRRVAAASHFANYSLRYRPRNAGKAEIFMAVINPTSRQLRVTNDYW